MMEWIYMVDFRVEKIKDLQLCEPMLFTYSTAKDDGTPKKEFLSMTTGAAKEFYGNLGIPKQTSKQIFEKSPEIWKVFIAELFQKAYDGDKHFDLTEHYVIRNGNEIVGFTLDDLDSWARELNILINSECNNLIMNAFDGVQAPFFLDSVLVNEEEVTPIFLLDMDFKSGKYRGYNAISDKAGRICTLTAPSFELDKFEDLLRCNIENECDVTRKLASQIVVMSKYDKVKEDRVLSVREVIDVLKCMGADVVLDKSERVVDITVVAPTMKTEIIKFFNAFGIPYKSLKSMPTLRKSLKYDHITVGNMLDMCSTEYFNPNNKADGQLLSMLMAKYLIELDKDIVVSEMK